MANAFDLTGMTFGRLTVLCQLPKSGKHRKWLCRCECGIESDFFQTNLTRGLSKSCGCLKKDTKNNLTHGLSRTAEHIIWTGIKQRCLDRNCKNYPLYGGRGISICQRWRHNFENFLEDMGPRPSPKHSIDRIDTNGHYEPCNCRWATRKEQARNTRTNRFVTIGGETKTVAEWTELAGLSAFVIYRRLDAGWPPEDLLLPAGARGSGRFQPRQNTNSKLQTGQTKIGN